MADRKISDLTALTTPASGDYLPIVDISEAAAASKNKRVTVQSLFQGIPVNVGIGTSSPARALTVNSSSSNINYVRLQENSANTPTNGGSFIELGGTRSDGGYGFYGGIFGGRANVALDNAGYLAFYADNNDGNSLTERMRIDSSGRVGIGTSSPAATLDIFGNQLFSAANPQIQFNAGGPIIRVPSANTIAFLTDSTTERLRIDSSGRLLVGTSSTLITSTVVLQGSNGATTSEAILRLCRGQDSPADGALLGDLSFGDSNNGDAARIFAQRDGGTWTSASSRPSRLVFSTAADGSATPTERMRITSGGAILGNTSSPSAGNSNTFNAVDASVNTWALVGRHTASSGSARCVLALVPNETGDSSVFFLGNRNNVDRFIVWSSGDVVNSNNSYGALSDLKLKTNITLAGSQWEDIKALSVKKYNFIDEPNSSLQIGLIAQDVEQVSPGLVDEAVDRDADGNDLGTVTKSIKYSVLYMKAVKALQEAMERIETLEAKVAALEAQ